MASEESLLTAQVELPFPSKRIAEIVFDVLRVDKEPKRSEVSKTLVVEDDKLKIEFVGSLARHLRVALNNFFEKLDLVLETIDTIGPPVSDKYDFY